MNGYLVVLRKVNDDLPISFHATLAEAEAMAEKVADDPEEAVLALPYYDDDWGDPDNGRGIVIFHFKDGIPVEVIWPDVEVEWADEETADAE
jgi:hypothetical protein